MYYRRDRARSRSARRPGENRAQLRDLVDAGVAPGLVGYLDGTPVGLDQPRPARGLPQASPVAGHEAGRRHRGVVDRLHATSTRSTAARGSSTGCSPRRSTSPATTASGRSRPTRSTSPSAATTTSCSSARAASTSERVSRRSSAARRRASSCEGSYADASTRREPGVAPCPQHTGKLDPCCHGPAWLPQSRWQLGSMSPPDRRVTHRPLAIGRCCRGPSVRPLPQILHDRLVDAVLPGQQVDDGGQVGVAASSMSSSAAVCCASTSSSSSESRLCASLARRASRCTRCSASSARASASRMVPAVRRSCGPPRAPPPSDTLGEHRVLGLLAASATPNERGLAQRAHGRGRAWSG